MNPRKALSEFQSAIRYEEAAAAIDGIPGAIERVVYEADERE
jgi:hypothetical protein